MIVLAYATRSTSPEKMSHSDQADVRNRDERACERPTFLLEAADELQGYDGHGQPDHDPGPREPCLEAMVGGYGAVTGASPPPRRSTTSATSAAGTTMLKPIRIPWVSPTAS